MGKQYKKFSSEEKVRILRRHLLEKEPVSKVCEAYDLHPNVFYKWQKEFFENGAVSFEKKPGKRERKLEEKITRLEEKISHKDEVIAEIMESHIEPKKKSWRELKGEWVPHDLRDEVIDYVRYWSDRTELAKTQLVRWVGIHRSKYYDWRSRYGKVNEHNAWIPRDHWLEEWEHKEIKMFYSTHPDEGYRRVSYMLMDADVVAVSPTSVYRVLKAAGLLEKWNKKVSKKGNGFTQPLTAHAHWHTDIMYLNIYGTFYYLISVLDGYSRYVVEWDIRESMTERDVEIVIQKAKERYPEVHPRLISDNGKQFMAKEFKEFIRFHGMSHVTTSPYYPQSNGKIERWHQSLRHECIRPGTPLTVEDARRIVEKYVDRYNYERLHSAIGYVTPRDKLEGRADKIHAERDRKLTEARERRRRNRQALMAHGVIDRKDLTAQEGVCDAYDSSVKQKRALLGSTSSGIADRSDDGMISGRQDTPSASSPSALFLSPSHALENPDPAMRDHPLNSERLLSISR